MTRISVRLSDPTQLEALQAHGAGDVSLAVRRLIVDHLGAGTAERPPPNFADSQAARKAALQGHQARAKRRQRKRSS
jgi:hypothetical protein